ncbi:hypothetical protein HPP92_003772 [Vanilla planifolia]|uniref:Uncharacterized protein n=1 Tax=Vanilla planifolia TaxID=51239 RepID=A0A835SB25_VANPL|nr:hypothetical protein HPP92_003772 [Vanilla planifolia]
MVYPGGLGSFWILILLLSVVITSAAERASDSTSGARGRLLLGFRETSGNVSFQCSPSGPCIPCQYSEKNDEKYHCSETGYRLPLQCIEVQESSEEEHKDKKQRKLLFELESGKRNYITYRSCVPADGEEKLSVLGFEVRMLCLLLISGAIVYLRKKRSTVLPAAGVMRIHTNSPRF